jgi:hypothetical protein
MELKETNIVDRIQLSSADVMLLDNGLVHVNIKTENEVTLGMASSIAEAREQLSDGVARLVLITANSKNVIPSPKGREFLATSGRSKYIIANAIVIGSISQKLMINFFIKINKPVIPTKFFDNNQNAIDWLLGQKD